MMNIQDHHLSLAKLQLDAVIKANVHKGTALTGRLVIFVCIFLLQLTRNRECKSDDLYIIVIL